MGYLVCNRCLSYYKMGPDESPEDFSRECECGGTLEYQEDSPEAQQREKIVHHTSFTGVKSSSATTIILLGVGAFIVGFILLFIIGFLGLILVILGIILLLKGYKDHTWVKGYKGEKIVSKNLKNLPSGFFIFNDVNIPLGRGNFDHVVVGPTGIFLVETKNLRGFLKINGDEWYGFRGKSGFNPGIQAKSNAVQFSKFLQQNLSFGNIWVNAIVALINPNFEVIKRPKYYDVKYVSELSDFIAGVPRNMNHQTIVSVVEFIQDYSSEVIYQKDDIDYGEEIEEDFSEQVVPAKSSSDAQEFVLPILKTLPPEFRIFSNIELSPKEGSIDFVVLGPNGVFLVECHNFSATFQINDEEWRIIRNFNGHLKYNPGMRAKQKAFRLSKFLNSKKLTKRRIWVNTVIALVNPDFKLIKQPEHCFVKSLDELANFIADYKGNIDQKSTINIVNCLLHEMGD